MIKLSFPPPHPHTLTLCLSQCEAELSESALIGYRRPVNEISMHGQTEILGALPEAGAHGGGGFPINLQNMYTLWHRVRIPSSVHKRAISPSHVRTTARGESRPCASSRKHVSHHSA